MDKYAKVGDSVLKSFKNGNVTVLEVDAEFSLLSNINIVKKLTNSGYSGVIVSTNRPCFNLDNIYKKYNVDTNKLIYIDCVCKSQGIKIENELENVVHISSISSLSELSITISTIAKKIEGKKFLLFGSLTSLLVYHTSNKFSKFMQDTFSKVRNGLYDGFVLIVAKSSDEELIEDLKENTDSYLKI
jgi:hypothetical protein